jgi:hypothetical protein
LSAYVIYAAMFAMGETGPPPETTVAQMMHVADDLALPCARDTGAC